jgi:hypothetical protein
MTDALCTIQEEICIAWGVDVGMCRYTNAGAVIKSGKCTSIKKEIVMYDKINIMMPTYKRPKMLRRCIDSILDTAQKKENICFTFMINKKDRSYDDFEWPFDTCVLKENLDEPDISEYFNRMYAETAHKGENILVSFGGDDFIYETPGWNTRVLDTINQADGVAVVHCDDAFIAHGTCTVNFFTTRKFVDAMGVPYNCPYYKRYYMDEAYSHIADAVDANYYLSDVVIRHDHMSARPQCDETYARLQGVGDKRGEFGDTKPMWDYVAKAVKNLKESGIL